MKNKQANTRVYKVLFRGVILSGFNKEDVINNVFNITRIPKATITRKFFSGKTVVIRHADSQEYASRLQKTFAQAGIETYIEEIIAVNNNDNNNDFDSPEITSSAQSKVTDTSSRYSPVILLLIGIIISAIVYGLYSGFFSDETPGAAANNSHSTMLSEAGNKTPVTEPATSSTVQKSTPEHQPVLLFEKSDVQQLIKITQNSEIIRLKRFMALFNFRDNEQKAINLLLEQPGIISPDTPLYLFKTSHNIGLYLTRSQNEITASNKQQINELLSYKSNNTCIINNQLTLSHQGKQYLLSNLENNGRAELFTALTHTLNNSSALFFPASLTASASFYLYSYSEPYPGFQITASDQQFEFRPKTIKAMPKMEQKLAISFSSPNQIQNLFDLSLNFIALQMPPLLLKPSQTFIPQQISEVKLNTVNPELTKFQPQLDIELRPLWHSGPFAITTSSYQFHDNHPVIQILSKGQNILPFMEYSQMARLQTAAVIDNNNKDVLKHNCGISDSSQFKNIDGKQEAFIDNDFVTFKSISNNINLQLIDNTKLSSIKQIKGQISLDYPEKISVRKLKLVQQQDIIKIAGLSLIFNLPEKNIITYQLLGNIAHFIALRAYNTHGDIIDTVNIQYQNRLNRSIKSIQQIFAEPVSSIKIFYAKKVQSLHYPYAFNPRISASQKLEAALQDNPPVAVEKDLLDIVLLSDTLINDNPQWLGPKIASRNVTPFYVSLFIQNEQQDKPYAADVSPDNQLNDALLNIKIAPTKLIKYNFSAAQLEINRQGKGIYNNFIHFTEKNLSQKQQPYLDSNTAIKTGLDIDKENLKGRITLSLPRDFESFKTDFEGPGQRIERDRISISIISQTPQTIEFEISGQIESLVQLKLYNKKLLLISEMLDFRRMGLNKARLSLSYYGEVDSIILITGKNILTKHYPFEL